MPSKRYYIKHIKTNEAIEAMIKYTVLLSDGTVGDICAEVVEIGQEVAVDLHDENGNPISVTRIVEEVLVEQDA
ncbi:hypothetical protein [Enterobacter sp.]|uniref:hypothetical protein n=1 Tax=Enterobacter sp. TaxID=42895 RepID=UPI00296F9820|nr:hypothetical protein [Enterobacter sp.]